MQSPASRSLPVARDVEKWRERAACLGLDLALFFSPDEERGRARAAREVLARQICQDCPVLSSCREHALNTDESYGIWGGMTESERRRYARRLPRGSSHPSFHDQQPLAPNPQDSSR